MSTYYVSTLGNDTTGTGTAALPWKTLAKAAEEAVAGDTVIVQGTRYNAAQAWTGSVGHVGTEANPITVEAETPGCILDSGMLTILGSNFSHDGDNVYSASCMKEASVVWVDDVQIISLADYTNQPLMPCPTDDGLPTGTYDATKMVRGMSFWADNVLYIKFWDKGPAIGRTIKVSNNACLTCEDAAWTTFSGFTYEFGWGGVWATDCSHLTFERASRDDILFNNCCDGIYTTSPYTVAQDGTFTLCRQGVYYNTDHCTFQRCIIDNCISMQFFSKANSYNGIADRCLWRNVPINRYLWYYYTAEEVEPTKYGHCLYMEGDNGKVTNCVFTGLAEYFIATQGANIEVYHNTFYYLGETLADYYALVFGSESVDLVVANNIFQTPNTPIAYQYEGSTFAKCDNNCFGADYTWNLAGVSKTVAAMQTAGYETNGVADDPDMTDPANGDFTIGADSPCLLAANADYCPATDYAGRSRTPNYADIGAYQYSVAPTAELSFMRPAESSLSFGRTPPVVATEAVVTGKGMFASNMFASWMFASRMFRASTVSPAILDQAITRPTETERVFSRP
jgi:hypothetical protein